MSVINNVKQLKENNFFIFIPRSNKLEPIKTNFYVNLEDLLEISYQKDVVLKNTKNFWKINLQIIFYFGEQKEWASQH